MKDQSSPKCFRTEKKRYYSIAATADRARSFSNLDVPLFIYIAITAINLNRW